MHIYIYIIHLFTYIVYLFINLKYLSGNYAIVDSSCQCDLDYLAVVNKSNVFFFVVCVLKCLGERAPYVKRSRGTILERAGHHLKNVP